MREVLCARHETKDGDSDDTGDKPGWKRCLAVTAPVRHQSGIERALHTVERRRYRQARALPTRS
jgi:hypothetical protein